MKGIRKVARLVGVVTASGGGDFTAYSVSREVGLSDTTCRKHLRRLEREGFLCSEFIYHRSNSHKQVFNVFPGELWRMDETYNLGIPKQLEMF